MSYCTVYRSIVAAILLCLTIVKSDIDYSKHAPNCHAKNVDFHECLHKSLQNAIQTSHKGVPELSIDPLDPYKMPDFSIKNPIGLSAKLTNINSTGLSKTLLQNLRVNIKQHHFEISVVIPYLRLIGNYELTGKLVNLPVKADGHSDSSLVDLQCTITIQGEPYKNGSDNTPYMKVKRVTTVINNAKKANVYIDRPFNNNKDLNNLVNHFLNDNWKDLFNTYKSDLEMIISQNVFSISQKYFSQIPYNVVFND